VNDRGFLMKKMMLTVTILLGMLFATPLFAADAIDINSATTEQLQSVKGIGPKTAAGIVAYREAHGDFPSVSGLTAVKGIGKKKLAKIKGALVINKSKKH